MAKQEIEVDIANEAANLVRLEKSAWEEATAFVTDRVAFQMRNLIRRLRKNYWGIFNTPVDPVTGHRKIWIPLSESIVEATVKNIDLDTKDINFRAKKPESIGLTAVLRSFVRSNLDKTNFGEKLDRLERTMSIDGTAVWKIIWTKEKGKKEFKIIPVDLLNLYIDPLADNLQETTVIERARMTKEEFMSMDEWVNKDKAFFETEVHPNDDALTAFTGTAANSQTQYAEVYERWGEMPKSLITGKESDKDELVQGRIVASGTRGKWVAHLIEENKSDWKPYEEVQLTKVDGRWHGKGQCEKVLMLQLWANSVSNIRINRHRVTQLGIFKIRKNSGITPQMVGRLAANGAIKVNDMADIEQMIVQDAAPSAYKDDEVIQSWAEKTTQVFEAATGETLPASTAATNAVLQARSAQSSFVMVKEQIGMFLQRVMDRHILPEMMKQLKPEDILRVTGEPEDIREIDKKVVSELLIKEVEKMNKEGFIVTVDEIEREKKKLTEQLRSMKDDRYMKIISKIDPSEFDTEVFVTNEEIDKSVLANNLTSVLNFVQDGETKNIIIRQLFDLMGLNSNQLESGLQEDLEQGRALEAQQGGQPGAQPASLPGLLAQANTLQGQATPQV